MGGRENEISTASGPERVSEVVQDVIAERRTVHRYARRALPPGALQRALLAALDAPNHRLTEPWRFIRVGPKTREALIKVGIHLATDGGARPLSEQARSGMTATVYNPAELVVVSQELDERLEIRREDYAAISCAIQNLSLVLWAEGIGSKWSTTEVTTHPKSYAALGLDSTRQCIVGFLWIGYPLEKTTRKPRRRRGLEEVLMELP